ncbi:hypothetical protein ASPBRDRAFT_33219 [Aspergillus brasiliensis CBS 101740]|uniref:Uncharacterized protein n=1 Tax=Aspergillus brasiliensis (strain CBS 101740 / IMI 381727 / IBT 21946) TaxID=767769 RepID=A0A1L9UAI8_ASPBC|nr:hypothetical protein ASPBRDRAFT_33219 [Aspergillus brasiliensis CBS 101740]
MDSIKNNEHQHEPSTNDPREVEAKLCQLMKDNLHLPANDPTEAEKQPHQPDQSPPLDIPSTDPSPRPKSDRTDEEEAEESSTTSAKEATESNNDSKTEEDEETDDPSTTPAKEETESDDDQLSQPSEDESNTPKPETIETKADRMRRERRAHLDEYIASESFRLAPRYVWQMEQDFQRTDWQAYAADPSYEPPLGTELELSEAEAEELERQEEEHCRLYEENLSCESGCILPDESWFDEDMMANERKLQQPSKDDPNATAVAPPREPEAEELKRQAEKQRREYLENMSAETNCIIPNEPWFYEVAAAVASSKAKDSRASDQVRTDPIVLSKP